MISSYFRISFKTVQIKLKEIQEGKVENDQKNVVTVENKILTTHFVTNSVECILDESTF